MKILITAGGGGHFSPALSIIESLPKDVSVLVVGRKYAFEKDKAISLEYRVAKERGIPFEPIVAGRMARSISANALLSLARVPKGFFSALRIVKGYKPDVIVSFGGYVTVPVIMVSALFRIPIIIHEQTLEAGLANKLASKFASKICISWEESRKYFPSKKVVLTGNPISEFTLGKTKDTYEKPFLLVMGGSSGSHSINKSINSRGCLALK